MTDLMGESEGTAVERSRNLGDLRLDEPVIVLTCARSGSTLLRFILDTHPSLACVPETGVVSLCGQMAAIGRTLDDPGHASPADSGVTPITLARHWTERMFGSYLLRAGKERWCDKTPGIVSWVSALEFFLEMYPKTRFICLYRHCMDVVDSVLEASPWGIRSFGLASFVADHPGNSVAAVADYWLVHSQAIADFERAHPDACLRVRYEDLVVDPDTQAGRIFDHLGEPPVPDITARVFATEHHLGRGDYKILATRRIHRASVGRGGRIPPQLIPSHLFGTMNELLTDLGYERMDPDRRSGTGAGLPARSPDPGAMSPGAGSDGMAAVFDELESLLAARVSELDEADRSAFDGAGFSFVVMAKAQGGDASRPATCSWRLDLDHRRVSRLMATDSPESTEWGAVGTVDVWRSIIDGRLNIGTALNRGELMYLGTRRHYDGPKPLHLYADAKMRILAHLLTGASAPA